MLWSKISKTSKLSKASLLLSVGTGSKRGKPTERLGHKATGLKPHKRGYGSRVANRAQCLPNAVTSRSRWGAHEVQDPVFWKYTATALCHFSPFYSKFFVLDCFHGVFSGAREGRWAVEY